jgi:hypothetical protein
MLEEGALNMRSKKPIKVWVVFRLSDKVPTWVYTSKRDAMARKRLCGQYTPQVKVRVVKMVEARES